jgi:SET domain-containing protein 6
MFWTDEELSQLKGTEVLPRIGKEKSEEQYTQLLLPIISVPPQHSILTQTHPELFSPTNCDRSAFHRMGSLVLAYSFGNSDSSDDEEDESVEIAMVPLADMLNANPKLNNVPPSVPKTNHRRAYSMRDRDGK